MYYWHYVENPHKLFFVHARVYTLYSGCSRLAGVILMNTVIYALHFNTIVIVYCILWHSCILGVSWLVYIWFKQYAAKTDLPSVRFSHTIYWVLTYFEHPSIFSWLGYTWMNVGDTHVCNDKCQLFIITNIGNDKGQWWIHNATRYCWWTLYSGVLPKTIHQLNSQLLHQKHTNFFLSRWTITTVLFKMRWDAFYVVNSSLQ